MTSEDERLKRQLMIEGWDQSRLSNAWVGVVADAGIMASTYVMSAAALGINNFQILDSGNFRQNKFFIDVAKKINPNVNIQIIQGFLTNPAMFSYFDSCNSVIDFSNYALANKICFENVGHNINLTSLLLRATTSLEGFKLFSYFPGREWDTIEDLISPNHFPSKQKGDPVLDIITAGIALEETAHSLMDLRPLSDDLISYSRSALDTKKKEQNILVVGAGALGNFLGLALAYSGFKKVTFMDPDVAELTNLNRQVLLYDSVGKSKAETLAKRVSKLGMKTDFKKQYFNKKTSLHNYDVVFDCVDNFETRIVLSEQCKNQGTTLVSGGTNISAGQAVYFNPNESNAKTPAEQLGLYDIVHQRVGEYKRERSSCSYRPNPSVIMTNQIIAGFMVDMYRQLVVGRSPENIYYGSENSTKI